MKLNINRNEARELFWELSRFLLSSGKEELLVDLGDSNAHEFVFNLSPDAMQKSIDDVSELSVAEAIYAKYQRNAHVGTDMTLDATEEMTPYIQAYRNDRFNERLVKVSRRICEILKETYGISYVTYRHFAPPAEGGKLYISFIFKGGEPTK